MMKWEGGEKNGEIFAKRWAAKISLKQKKMCRIKTYAN